MSRLGKKISIFLIFILVLSNFAVYAQTPTSTTPTSTSETTTDTSEESTSTTTSTDTSSLYTSDLAGVTPDSALYTLELAYETFQLAITTDPVEETELLSSQLIERHAEAETMLQQENYEALETVSEATQETYEDLQETVEQIPPTEENLELIHEIEEQTILQENHIEEMNLELQTQVQAGELTAEVVENIGLTAVEEATVGVQAEAEDTEDHIVETIAEEQGITTLEAQIQVEAAAEESGLLDLQEEEIREELVVLEHTIEEAEAHLGELTQAGTEVENAEELNQIIDEAQLQLQRCEDFYEHGQIDNAFAELSSAEHLALTAEHAVSQDENFDYSELVDLAEEVEQNQQERIEEVEDYIEEYEEAREELTAQNPEQAEEYEYYYEQAQKARELSETLGDSLGELREELLAEGKSEEEIDEVMGERWNQEYRLLYGEEYHPPGVEIKEEVFGIDRIVYQGESFDPTTFQGGYDPETNLETSLGWDGSNWYISVREGIDSGSVVDPSLIIFEGKAEVVGGIVKDQEYVDPISGFKYEITDSGYEYTTPSGIKYSESWPEGYNPEDQNAYEKGNEVHQVIEKTDEGSIIYNYFATGYEVVLADGTSEAYSYPKGDYETVSGEKIEIDATGYKVESSSEEGSSESSYSHKYEYNPEFQNYAAKLDSGELVTFHAPEGAAEHYNMDYIGDSNLYTYTSGGENWLYNPSTHAWASSSGETYKPEATTLAPVGHEDSGHYDTNTGKTWEWDSSSQTWKDTASGESYNTASNQYSSAEGHTWTYDSSTGSWSNPTTGETHTDTSSTPGTATDSSGIAWTYDSSTGSWSSSTGDSWTYDSSTGSWSNPTTGETHTDTSYSGGTTTDTGGMGTGSTPH